MKEDRIRAVLEAVAQNNHTTVKEVKKEIELSITEAIETAVKTTTQKDLRNGRIFPVVGKYQPRKNS